MELLDEAISEVQKMWIVVQRMLHSGKDVEDVLQNARLNIWKNIHKFRHDSKVSTWVYRLVMNEALMYLRHSRCRPRWGDENHDDLEDINQREDNFTRSHTQRLKASLAKPQKTPSMSPEYFIQVDEIEKMISKLPPGMQQVFRLHYIEGYEHHEIGAIIGTTAGNSKSQLFKAKMKIRKMIHETSTVS